MNLKREGNWMWKAAHPSSKMLLFTIVFNKAMSQTKWVQIVPPQHGPLHDLFSMYSKEGIPSWVSHPWGGNLEPLPYLMKLWMKAERCTPCCTARCFTPPLFALCLLMSSNTTISWRYAEVPAWHGVLAFIISPGVIWNLWSQQLTGICFWPRRF